ncbi:NAD-dependent epimerase/dehydratase family protein [Microcoleus sp. Pol11C1]|uniref:NAD-dependent epimerase/dehydratase family protein n=1 Tax=unclassified Microcoleus TaxID=2642155 RepID=UPI002FD092EA
MKILVIGGTAFIGRYVTQQLLQNGHEVSVFNRGVTLANLPLEVNHIRGDRQNLTDYRQTFEQLAPDVVVDMIALTEADAQSTMDTFKEVAQRVVAISSQDVYRARDILWGRETGTIDTVPLTEDAPLRSQLYPYRDPGMQPQVPPDYDKILVERVMMSYPSLPGTVLRLPMVYGVGDYQHRFYPFIKRMDDRRPVILLEEGYAHWHGSYGYVENVAAAIVLAVTDERATNRIYNVAESSALSPAELIRTIGQIVGWHGEVVIVSKSRLPQESRLDLNIEQEWLIDSTRIREELGYTEPIDRDEALRRTLTWERANPPEVFSAIGLLDYATEDSVLASRLNS